MAHSLLIQCRLREKRHISSLYPETFHTDVSLSHSNNCCVGLLAFSLAVRMFVFGVGTP